MLIVFFSALFLAQLVDYCSTIKRSMPCFLQVLNLLMFKLTKRRYDEALLGFLFVDEHLVDIGDDLVDYEVQHLSHQHLAFCCVGKMSMAPCNACRMMS